MKIPKVAIDILILRDQNVLLGKLTDKWTNGKELYGVPGRDLYFNERIGECVKRNIWEELGCETEKYNIFCINANYEFGNHYISIGVQANISGEPKLLKPDDWKSWEWVPLNNLPENIFAPAKNLFECYFKNTITVSQ